MLLTAHSRGEQHSGHESKYGTEGHQKTPTRSGVRRARVHGSQRQSTWATSPPVMVTWSAGVPSSPHSVYCPARSFG